MIDYLRGRVVHLETDYIVIDVAGVGYRVFCSNPYAFQAKKDAETIVYIHHNVREDAILLYGFPSREEQSLFRILIGVSGIGPKVAIGILSGARPEAVAAAIHNEDITFLTKLPGIGKKTAQRIILDLKDKLSGFIDVYEETAAGVGVPMPAADGPQGSNWAEARQGLLALGYTEAEADRVWRDIKPSVSEHDSVERLMKLALQKLYAG